MTITVAAIQMSLTNSRKQNITSVTEHVIDAQAQGAHVVLPPELFEGRYFPQSQDEELFSLAHPIEGHPTVLHFQHLCKQLGVVVPVSIFERCNNAYYNSVVVIDADGRRLGVYRKSHIPDGPGYQEKFYFRPGDTGFRVWKTRYGTIGIGICWDQWFPEAARAMVLAGADLLLYPTAIGTEPANPSLCTKDPWRRVMVGHAVANVVGLVAANRVGTEQDITFYGHSFAANHRGDIVAELGANDQGILCGNYDLEHLQRERASYGFFRDRRPDLYHPLVK